MVKIRFIIFLILLISPGSFLYGQETYTVVKAPFSSDTYDEFCPVFYKNGIVFCTNRSTNSLLNYADAENSGEFKIFYIDTTGKVTWSKSGLLSKDITSKLNDGPATFNAAGDTVYFSRNLKVDGSLKELNNPRNKLGIFSAVFEKNKWTKIRELRFNNGLYNITSPCLSPDGRKLFFASDKPDGYGGFDLYCCEWKGYYWDNPVNLGPGINTRGNEAYPFMNQQGELFFSSDSLPGLGGKDIFVTAFIDNKWMTPVHLDAPINSKFDDFGIVTDSTVAEGFFSSNRNHSLDIFHFRTIVPQVFYAPVQQENNYCFQFADSGSIIVDTLNLRYVWDFGDGEKAFSKVARHCFKGPGHYSVRLDIFDKSTGNLFFSKLSYNLDLSDYIQPFINSPELAVNGEPVTLDGLKSSLPGMVITNYTWDFGDGTRMQGEKVSHVFKKSGEYLVRLGLTLKSAANGEIHSTGISKKIVILDSEQEKRKYSLNISEKKSAPLPVEKYKNATISNLYSSESENQKDAVFEVELLSSKTKIGVTNTLFHSIPEGYRVIEKYDTKAALYRYVINEQLNLMLTYNSFHQAITSGLKSAHVIIEPVDDAANKELNSIKKIFGSSTDIYFDKNGRLTSEAFLVLDQVFKILTRYNSLKLEIAIHTDDNGLPADKLKLSQQYAQIIAKYLTNKGLDYNRLIANGYGGSTPVASNHTEKGKALNRRVEFLIIK